MEGAHIYTYLS